MGFQLDSDRRELREEVRTFGENHVVPIAREADRRGEVPERVFEAAADRGYVGPMIPTDYGGAGFDTLEAAIVTEELWRADTSVGWALGLAGFSTNVYVLSTYGDEWMREEWLTKVAAGEARDGIAVTEPDHGSNVAGIETTAERDGDEWVLNGEKKWIGNADVADVLYVFAKTDPGAGHRGVSVFLVPTDVDGLETEPITDTLGGRAAPVGRVFLDDARVPARNLVGEENEGFYYFMEALGEGRVTVAAQAVGAAAAAVEATREYATEREQFDQPIADFQAVQHTVADMATETEAARSLLYRAAEAVERGDDDAARLASMAKLFASERAVSVTDDAIQVHGGNGYLGEYDVERYFRDVRVTKIYEGANDVQRNIVGEDLL